ncbi:MAG: TrkA family potassium uptake protein [Bacilli bacterium]|nr:TrkA family potassium uptake protein [Bacilli bacterium]
MKREKAIIIGSGRLGSYIASELSVKGHEVVIIDKDGDAFRKLNDQYSGYRYIGDAVDSEVLEQAGIEDADILIATTNNDNTNIFVSHIASMIYFVDKVYLRLGDIEKSTLIENTSIHAIYPFKLSMDEFNRNFGGGNNENSNQ